MKPWQPDPDGSSIRGFQEIQESDTLVIPDPTNQIRASVPICLTREGCDVALSFIVASALLIGGVYIVLF